MQIERVFTDVMKVARHFSAGYAFKSELVPKGRLKATSGNAFKRPYGTPAISMNFPRH